MAVDLGIGAYAALGLQSPGGEPLGILAVIDPAPRAWSAETLAALRDCASAVTRDLELRRAVSDGHWIERQLRHAARHDSLTGLPNRAYFMERLRHALERPRHGIESTCAVLFLDLDNFKVVNDSLGHHAGDELLITVASRLQGCTRGADVVARLGGDEFAILLTGIGDGSDAARVAERILADLGGRIDLGGYEVFSSVSIGIALSAVTGERPEYLVRSADMAMYRAQQSGRARFELFDRAMHADALRRLQLETELRHALERDEFLLHYQPIVSLASGRIVGAEALLRWQHLERGVVSPADFVPIAEDTGLIIPLGYWALEEACRQACTWRPTAPGRPAPSLNVNLSVKQFAQRDLVERVARALQETGLEASRLNLEITESIVIEKPELATHVLTQLKALGVRIHMDDFGTGYSSLGYLHRLPLDALKIDREFISHMESSGRALQLVRTIQTLVRDLGLKAIAEGVTTTEQLRLVREIGCHAGQGYLFSAPLDAEAFRLLLDADPRW
jgi:diguanylate cyclase (GGDEF)-like protein